MLDALEAYAMAGYTLFPLKGKIPPKGFKWTESEFNPFPQPEDFPFGNLGVKLAEDDLVIDVDPRNFPDKDLFKRFVAEFPIDAQFSVTTGSGGLHIYLKKPATMAIKGRLKDWPGIDFKSKGGYVVGAFSLHPDTSKPYLPNKNCTFKAPMVSDKLLDALCQQAITLTPGIESYVKDKASIDRFAEYLEKAPIAIQGQGGDNTTFCVCAIGHDFGLHPDDTFELMAKIYNPLCQPPWDVEELKRKVYNAYKYTAGELGNKTAQAVGFPENEVNNTEVLGFNRISELQQKLFHRNTDHTPKKDQHNTVLFFTPGFEFDGLLRFNQFSNEIEFTRKAPWHHLFETVKTWNDGEALRCKFYLSHFYHFEPSTINLHEAAYVAASHKHYHPVKDYLESLEWDGHKRCHSWLSDVLGVINDDYSRAVGMKFLVAAVKRIYEPGCKYDYIMVLEGRQGTFKSTTFEILASKQWYADPSMDITNKDSITMLFGKWIIELPEMETHFKSETQAMKAFLTRNTDRCRLPYHRVPMDFPRQSIFGGTINPDIDEDLGWLKDTTGNRRYWPVKVGVEKQPDLNKLRQIRDQLWAEALFLYHQKVNIYMDDDNLILMAKKEQDKRLSKDMWFDTIQKYLTSNSGKDLRVVTSTELYRDALGGNILHCSRREQHRIASVMAQLGWERGIYHNPSTNSTQRGYRRPALVLKTV